MVKKEQLNHEAELREEYAQKIKQLLLGPGSENISSDLENEILSEKPEDRYVTGLLYSNKDQQSGQLSEVDETDLMDVDNEFKPSSMGLTFYVRIQSKARLKVHLKTAIYTKTDSCEFRVSEVLIQQLEEISKKYPMIGDCYQVSGEMIKILAFGKNSGFRIAIDLIKKEGKLNELKSQYSEGQQFIEKFAYQYGPLYTREPQTHEIIIDLNRTQETYTEVWTLSNEQNVNVFSRIQSVKSGTKNSTNQEKAVTIVLQNTTVSSLFQSEITVDNQVNIDFISSEETRHGTLRNLDYEDAMNEMLYRKKRTYAVGRGVSVNWQMNQSDIEKIYTTYIPSHEIFPMLYDIAEIKSELLDPNKYVGQTKSESLSYLKEFIGVYRGWIDKLKNRVARLPEQYQKYGLDNIEKCNQSYERMQRSIEILDKDELAFNSFKIANEAILLQKMKNNEQKLASFNSRDYSKVGFLWRPFQLAYILNSLESTLNEDSQDRDKLDLIWVSTGAGKTEAYLFSIAAVIAYRRQAHKYSGGVTAIMRYTLRLLTSQQFERAARLICAMEFIRRNGQILGDEPISIGLWIGSGTENVRKYAQKDFKKMCESSSYQRAKELNKFQILKCPWCGEEDSLVPTEKNYHIQRRWGYKSVLSKTSNVEMKCMNSNCPFSDINGLPIYVVDEDIYQVRPSLLFGTVDKFAQVPLKEDAERLLGSDDIQHYRRPELIIQDEFHLISGPLGSLVGLFETGFDYVFGQGIGQKRPKYIASTATIRNAETQAKGVFNREVQQFPSSGLEAEDRFFVKEDTKSHGRKYFGVMGTGKSQITTEVRLIAALLQITKNMNLSSKDEELFWTVTGYFNSLRELGKANNLITSDVSDQLSNLKKRNGINKRNINSQGITELTSRIDSSKIPTKIEELNVAHDQPKNDMEAKDILIATNMLSVGIDIKRLNTMFVVGQPKLTSEYIQATSRVGRENLGSVWTLYNSTRSRDRSHYETFQAYHQNMYKYVEATSVTPFSAPALNKAIASVFVTMLRNSVESLSGDHDPQNITDQKSALENAEEYILERIKNSPDSALYLDKAKEILQRVGNEWLKIAEESREEHQQLDYYYNKFKNISSRPGTLLRGFNDNHPERENAIPTMETMRTVEDNSFLNIKGEE